MWFFCLEQISSTNISDLKIWGSLFSKKVRTYKLSLVSPSARFSRALEFSNVLFWKIKKWVRWRFHFFTENLKMAPFWPKLAHFEPKCPKPNRGFRIFSKTAHWNFLIFARLRLWSRKNGIVKLARFWQKMVTIRSFWAFSCPFHRR